MSDLIQLIVSGVALGMIYALLAFGYNITFSTSRTINFAQGEFLMLGALIGLTIDVRLKMGYVAAALSGVIAGALLGVVLERIAIRPALRTGSTVAWVLATVALGIVARNAA
jgi:branched-chain amino acid transport system permease protein